MTAVDEPLAPEMPLTFGQPDVSGEAGATAPGARRDCPDCGTFLVMMPVKEQVHRWKCFGGQSHVFELGSGRELVRVPSPRKPLDDGHGARVAEEIERWTAEHVDGLGCHDEL